MNVTVYLLRKMKLFFFWYQTGSMHSFSQRRSTVSFLYSVSDRPATISHDISGGFSKNNGTSENRDADVFKHIYVLHVIIALMGIFVLYFSICVVTYIFLKCFRKNAKDDDEMNMSGKCHPSQLILGQCSNLQRKILILIC